MLIVPQSMSDDPLIVDLLHTQSEWINTSPKEIQK